MIIWIGCGGHSPSSIHPMTIKGSICWHSRLSTDSLYNYLNQTHNAIGDISDFQIVNDELFFKNEKLCFNEKENAACIFTWNYYHVVSHNLLDKFIKIETLLSNKSIKVINPISMLTTLYKKDVFFDFLTNKGMSEHVPEYEIINHKNQLKDNDIIFPYILRTNIDTGGDNTFLVNSVDDAQSVFNKLDILKRKNIDTKILKIKYYNTYNEHLDCYSSSRISFIGSTINYFYPHVSTENWCIHTDMKGSSPSRDVYIKADKVLTKFIKDNLSVFINIKNNIDIDFLALDFIIADSRTIILEAELKYGCDDNYIKGQLNRYNLSDNYITDKISEIRDGKLTFKNIVDSFFAENTKSS